MEFENLQIEVPLGIDSSLDEITARGLWEKKHHNFNKGFVVGFNPNSKESISRRDRRAKRFGLNEEEQQIADDGTVTVETPPSATTITTSTHEDEPPAPPGDPFESIDIHALEWPPVCDEAFEEIRPGVVHIYGVDDMSTNDVFEYFQLYGPECIEWIDDHSCNVVWDDDKMAMRAMDELSKTYAKLQKVKPEKMMQGVMLRPSVTDDTETATPPMEQLEEVTIKKEPEEEDEAKVPLWIADDDEAEDDRVPARDVWRIGASYNDQQLFFRVATVMDKKLPGAAARSEYYLTYGKAPDGTKNGPGVISASRKRRLDTQKKQAEDRFKQKDVPDVQIFSMEQLKEEGIIQKMDVDDDEPVVKRLTLDPEFDLDEADAIRTDLTAIERRLGYDSTSNVRDRLDLGPCADEEYEYGEDDELKEELHGTTQLRPDNRLSEGMQARLGTSSDRHDNRHHDNEPVNKYEHVYEEDDDCVHDIYQATNQNAADSKDDVHRNSRHDDDERPSRRRMQSRLGSVASPASDAASPPMDLREKLKARRAAAKAAAVEVKEEIDLPWRRGDDDDVKDEKDAIGSCVVMPTATDSDLATVTTPFSDDKPNLCIEIKREVDDDVVMVMADDGVDIDDETFDF